MKVMTTHIIRISDALQEPVQIHAVPAGMSMLIRILTNIIKQLKVLLESA